MHFEILPVTRFAQNCSILWCETSREAVTIDPGGDLDQIRNLIDLEDLHLHTILVTHGHFDHAGGAAKLAAATGARIEGPHHDDAHLLRDLALSGQRYGVRAEPYLPARWLDHGDKIRFGAETLDVLHCPGHTRGHVAFFHPESRTAFVGDTLFRHAIGAWEHADGNLAQLVQTIRAILFPLGDDVLFVPGHGETSTLGHERAANPFVGDEGYAKRWTGG